MGRVGTGSSRLRETLHREKQDPCCCRRRKPNRFSASWCCGSVSRATSVSQLSAVEEPLSFSSCSPENPFPRVRTRQLPGDAFRRNTNLVSRVMESYTSCPFLSPDLNQTHFSGTRNRPPHLENTQAGFTGKARTAAESRLAAREAGKRRGPSSPLRRLSLKYGASSRTVR